MNSLRPQVFAGLVSLAAPMAFAQGVPTFDAGMFLQRERVLQQGEQDLALQRDRLSKEEELEELEQEQLQVHSRPKKVLPPNATKSDGN